MFDAIVNFAFLFGIAVLPYTVQTFLRFKFVFASFAIYAGNFSLILLTLAILRVQISDNAATIRTSRAESAIGAAHSFGFFLAFC